MMVRVNFCPFCEKEFPSRGLLKIHEDAVHHKKSFKCDTCGVKRSQISSLNEHKRTAHDKVTYDCHLCGKKFIGRTSLKNHVAKVHEGETQKHECNLCVCYPKYNQISKVGNPALIIELEKLFEPFRIRLYETVVNQSRMRGISY